MAKQRKRARRREDENLARDRRTPGFAGGDGDVLGGGLGAAFGGGTSEPGKIGAPLAPGQGGEPNILSLNLGPPTSLGPFKPKLKGGPFKGPKKGPGGQT